MRGPISLEGVVLKIALDTKRLRKLEPAALVLFRCNVERMAASAPLRRAR